jgi:hypothetical protein
MRSSPRLMKSKVQSREKFGWIQKLCSLQRKVAEAAEVATLVKVQRGIREMKREIIRETTIGKGWICGSTSITSGEGISPRTP